MAPVEISCNQFVAERRLFKAVDYLRSSHNCGFWFVSCFYQFDEHEESHP